MNGLYMFVASLNATPEELWEGAKKTLPPEMLKSVFGSAMSMYGMGMNLAVMYCPALEELRSSVKRGITDPHDKEAFDNTLDSAGITESMRLELVDKSLDWIMIETLRLIKALHWLDTSDIHSLMQGRVIRKGYTDMAREISRLCNIPVEAYPDPVWGADHLWEI